MSSIILNKLGVSQADLNTLTQKGLADGVAGEFYFAQSTVLSVSISQGIIAQPYGAVSAGGALRRINNTTADFVAFDGLNLANAENAVNRMTKVPAVQGKPFQLKLVGDENHASFYTQQAVLGSLTNTGFLTEAVELLKEIDSYGRSYDKRVINVGASLTVQDKHMLVQRFDGRFVEDTRPVVQLLVQVYLKGDDGTVEAGSESIGVPMVVTHTLKDTTTWQGLVHRAVEQASNNLTAVEIKGGNDYEIVVGGGWGGVVLHEAYGHALEADFHRKGIAVFQDMLGQRVASKGVNIYDDGTVQDARGSYNFDDEGNPTGKNLLVEDGILVGLMTDEMSAAALNMKATGNGRRQTYSDVPMPRMTNTYMAPGKACLDDLISGVKKGLYVTQFGGGQVDITSGKFEFNATQARIIENGRLGPFVKGASLAGMGKEAYMHVKGVSDNFELSKIGNCGKDGQSVPVTVGQADTLFEAGAMSVGGTA